MTISQEELPKLLEQAARAMGLKGFVAITPFFGPMFVPDIPDGSDARAFAPHKSDDQAAELNAALDHNTKWFVMSPIVQVGEGMAATKAEHDGTTQDKLRAWREASIRAAAMVGERMMEEEL